MDADCKGELECFKKVGLEYVPGCVTGRHGGVSGMNHCYQVPTHRDTIGINPRGSVPRQNTWPQVMYFAKGLSQGLIPMYVPVG